jgi:hypothetical protein
MAASRTQEAISTSSRAVAEDLRAAGFRRQGIHLHRASGELIHGLHFQASQWGGAVEGSFTTNVIVTSAFLYGTWTGKPLPKNPATALFPIAERIGVLMPGRSDYWWRVDEKTDLRLVAADVAEAVRGYAVAFLARFPDHDAILAAVRAGPPGGMVAGQIPLVHAMLAARAGLSTEAGSLLESAAAAATGSFRGTVARIAERLGIAFPARV